MADVSVLKALGLYTAPNELSAVPAGALTQADNVVIRSPGVIEPRRGHYVYGTFGTSATEAYQLLSYGSTLLVHYGDGSATTLGRNSAGTVTAYSGTYSPVDVTLARMRGVESRGNFYFNTSAGLSYLDSVTATPASAGVPRGWTGSAAANGATAVVSAGSQVAYRVVWGLRDANGYVKLGVPSGRIVFVNTTGATVDTTFTALIPRGVTTSNFFRVYRSENSGSVSTPPADEMFLIAERGVTSADLTAGSIIVNDYTPDSFLGDPLYTNAGSGEGIESANFSPPISKDLVLWSDRLWFANTTGLHRLVGMAGLGASAPDGIQNGDVICLGTRVYRFNNPLTGAANEVFIETAYDSGTDLAKTIQSLESIVQQDVYANPTLATVIPFYASGEQDAPGKFDLEALTLGGSSFTVGVSRPSAWASALPRAHSVSSGARAGSTVTITTATSHGLTTGDSVVLACFNTVDANYPVGTKTVTVTGATTFTYTEAGTGAALSGTYYIYKPNTAGTSTNEATPNRLMYSKLQEPEGVPLLNYLDVGSKAKAIHRIVPLRDRLYVFKEDGIYAVTGEYPFRVDLVDDTVRILVPDSAATVGNQIYAVTSKGVVAVGGSGVETISRPIKNLIDQALVPSNLSNVRKSFGVGYESEDLYILWLYRGTAADSNIGVPGVAYVYNTMTNAWSKWDLARNCGLVLPAEDTLYTASTNTSTDPNELFTERKTGTAKDYSDREYTTTVTLGGGATSLITVASTANISVGDVLAETSGSPRATGLVTSVPSSGVVGVKMATTGAANFTTSRTVDIRKGIPATVKWAVQTAGAPEVVKHWRDLNIHFKSRLCYAPYATTATERSTSATSSVLAFPDRSFQSSPDIFARQFPTSWRVLVAAEKQQSKLLEVGFTITEAYAPWALHGYSLVFEPVSERGNK